MHCGLKIVIQIFKKYQTKIQITAKVHKKMQKANYRGHVYAHSYHLCPKKLRMLEMGGGVCYIEDFRISRGFGSPLNAMYEGSLYTNS